MPHRTRVCNTSSSNCTVAVSSLSMCVHFAYGEQVNVFCSAVFNCPMKLEWESRKKVTSITGGWFHKSQSGTEEERSVFKCTSKGTIRCRWGPKRTGRTGENSSEKMAILQQTDDMIRHLISTCRAAPLTAGWRWHLLRQKHGKPPWTLDPDLWPLAPYRHQQLSTMCLGTHRHTHTHASCSLCSRFKKNETNISPSTFWKVCIFQLFPSATLGLNLCASVFLFKHAVHIHLFCPRAFGLQSAGCADSEGTQQGCWCAIPSDIITLSSHDISNAWITHLSARWLQSGPRLRSLFPLKNVFGVHFIPFKAEQVLIHKDRTWLQLTSWR